MSNNPSLTYDKALERIEEIISLLEMDDKGIDALSGLVREASGLIKDCKLKLRMTEDEITNAFGEEN